MDNENEQAQVEQETVQQEETTEESVVEENNSDDVAETSEEELPEDDSISISKSELTKLKRKAIAYDSGKQTARPAPKYDGDRLERIELRQEGYSPDGVQAIMDLGGTKVLNSKIVQSAIKYMRADEKSKNASTTVSSKSPVYKKFTQDDMSKMSAKEMEKILRE